MCKGTDCRCACDNNSSASSIGVWLGVFIGALMLGLFIAYMFGNNRSKTTLITRDSSGRITEVIER